MKQEAPAENLGRARPRSQLACEGLVGQSWLQEFGVGTDKLRSAVLGILAVEQLHLAKPRIVIVEMNCFLAAWSVHPSIHTEIVR